MPKDKLWTRTFTLLCAAAFMTYLAFYSTMPVLPLFLSEKHGIVGWQAGTAIAVYTIASVFARLYCGYLLDSYGRRVVYLLSFLFFSGLFLLYIPVAGFAAILILRVAHGVGWGLVTTSAQTAVADAVPASRRGEGIGMFGLFFSLAMAVSPFIGLRVIREFGYSSLFVLEAVSALIGMGCAYFATFLPTPRARSKFRPRSMIEGTGLPIGLVVFLFFMGYGAIANWVAVYALGIRGADGGIFFTCTAVGTALARLVSGKIYDRRGPIGICAIGFALWAGAWFLLAGVPCAVSFYAAGAMTGAGMGIFLPISLAIANSLVKSDRRGAANSTFYVLFDSGFTLGLWLTGAFMPLFGLSWAFAIFGGVALAGAAFFYIYAWPYSRRKQCAMR